MPQLSTIILNWNTREHLEKCIESILSSPPSVEFEIIVVDNNSKEDVAFMAERDERIRVIRNNYNHGFSVGNNIGYRASRGRYVMPLNPDTLLFPGTIDRLIAELENDPLVAIAVPAVRGRKFLVSNYRFTTLFFDSIALRHIRKWTERPIDAGSEPFDVEFIGGTGYICRRSALAPDKIFREDYFLFGEEYQLCREITEKGFKIRVVPGSEIEHFSGVTFKSDPERLAMASKLGSAIGWQIRMQRWGRILGTLSGIVLWLENLAKYSLAVVPVLFFRNGSDKYKKVIAQSGAIVTSFVPLLIRGQGYVRQVNEQVKDFFNESKKPPVG